MISEKLKGLRKEKGFTQKELATAINVDVSTYSGYERGLHEPSYLTLAKIIHVLKVDANYFFKEE